MRQLLNTFFPTRCLLCDLNSDNGRQICIDCNDTLPVYQTGCKRCATLLEIKAPGMLCGDCLRQPPSFDKILALFYYQAPISTFIWQLKFHHNLGVARLFADDWIYFLRTFLMGSTLPDVIIPVPLHHERLKERGFNQALEIAKPIGKYFNIPVDTKTCIRIKNTRAQSSLPARKRKHNVNNAFGLSYTPTAKHIAIVDDVVTTGNTISEISALFRKSGVSRIDVWCCARA